MRRPNMDDPDLPLGVIFDHWPQVASLFLGYGMACVGCPIAPFHSVSDACHDYGLDEATFRAALTDAASKTP